MQELVVLSLVVISIVLFHFYLKRKTRKTQRYYSENMEEALKKDIRKTASRNSRIVYDLYLTDKNNGFIYHYDIIAINQNGVFIIETKKWENQLFIKDDKVHLKDKYKVEDKTHAFLAMDEKQEVLRKSIGLKKSIHIEWLVAIPDGETNQNLSDFKIYPAKKIPETLAKMNTALDDTWDSKAMNRFYEVLRYVKSNTKKDMIKKYQEKSKIVKQFNQMLRSQKEIECRHIYKSHNETYIGDYEECIMCGFKKR